MRKFKILGFIALLGATGCSFNRYPLPNGKYFTRIQWFQSTEFKEFEMVSGTNTVRIKNGSNKTQADVVEAATRGAVQGAINGAKPPGI
jgi:hypothetical protein